MFTQFIAELQDSEWARLRNEPLFARAAPGGPTLAHLIDIYLERSHLLWRPQEAQVSGRYCNYFQRSFPQKPCI